MVQINSDESYKEATIKTASDLKTVATTLKLHELSQLSLPEIDKLTDEIARVVPAGNIPAMILNGLVHMDKRHIDPAESTKHVELLFRGVRQSVNRAIYTAFFATPAAVIYGYQQILRLAGKNPDEAFSEGTWQFYLEFALREDSARHANETTGFHEYIRKSKANEADQLAAWIITTLWIIGAQQGLLANEWREYVVLRLLVEAAEASNMRNVDDYRKLRREWERILPYRRRDKKDYNVYRQEQFDDFWRPHYKALNRKATTFFDESYPQVEAEKLPAFQHQMSWLAYTQANKHREERVHYPQSEAHIGVIYDDRYYLMPLGELKDLAAIRRYALDIVNGEPAGRRATLDEALVTVKRASQEGVREELGPTALDDLEKLRRTPILINWTEHNGQRTLSAIRNAAKRGIGDHPMTIIRTTESMVFDQSHIFFDGAWGAAIAQLMTFDAVDRIRYIATQPNLRKGDTPYSPSLSTPKKLAKAAESVRIGAEISAESTMINLRAIRSLRQVLKQRSELTAITVNDLLILYRGIHAAQYQPSEGLRNALEKVKAAKKRDSYQAVQDALKHIQNRNPAILIPIDARRFDPRERVYPMTFRNPFTDFHAQHRRTLNALRADDQSGFKDQQLTYLRMVGGFGELLKRYKEIALEGKSTSTTSIKFMAHLPDSLKTLLNNIPGRFDILNEILKGEEVFSNVGQVAAGSSLRRFISAKDDNDQKTLVWGVQTAADGTVYITLRDFRPYIPTLLADGLQPLAQRVVQDYLDAYVNGLNTYCSELREIAEASSQTRRGLFQQLFR